MPWIAAAVLHLFITSGASLAHERWMLASVETDKSSRSLLDQCTRQILILTQIWTVHRCSRWDHDEGTNLHQRQLGGWVGIRDSDFCAFLLVAVGREFRSVGR